MADEAATTPAFIAPEVPAAQTSGDSAESTTTEVDYKDRYEAQQKVNRDLERKFKDAAAIAARTTELEAKLAEMAAKADGKEAEFKAAQEKAALEKANLDKAFDIVRRSEVKAAAKGVLADPADAYKFLDLGKFEVDVDGNVDEAAIAKALADLVAAKPYLGAQSGQRFKGTADGGARNDASKPSQLTQADMARMSPEQIVEADEQGRFDDLRGSR